ncbi:hypothetical protein O181_063274 [Austropuccinia psidii MF-1]|uniref:Uncharacterized protein n=1 Tax=Austropuccinia psidii MF-1 TaxID=1389203 RepID=A0A9Q3ELT8_9BASI|nr:hypothetical protein [Austropuccinia psidii MF-1]
MAARCHAITRLSARAAVDVPPSLSALRACRRQRRQSSQHASTQSQHALKASHTLIRVTTAMTSSRALQMAQPNSNMPYQLALAHVASGDITIARDFA